MTKEEIHKILSLIPKEGIIDVTEHHDICLYENGLLINKRLDSYDGGTSCDVILEWMKDPDTYSAWIKFFDYIKECAFKNEMKEIVNE